MHAKKYLRNTSFFLYAIENFDGDFTLLYGGYNYTSAKSTINDEMQKFIEHIIDPFIDHISEHLRRCYEKAVREESKKYAYSDWRNYRKLFYRCCW